MVDRAKLTTLIVHEIEEAKVSPTVNADTLLMSVATLRNCLDWAQKAERDSELEEVVRFLETNQLWGGRPWNEARL